MNSWYKYYKNRPQSASNIILHWQYLFNIIKRCPRGLLEIGCGLAHHSLFVRKLLPFCRLNLIDSDPDIIAKLKKNYKDEIELAKICNVLDKKEIESANLPKVDLVISQGLMEHFDDDDFVKVIQNFRNISKKMLFSVPSDTYPKKDFGNEILRSQKQIVCLLKNIDNISFKVSPYWDIGWRTKMIYLQNRDLNFIQKSYYLVFGSNHFLVHIKYESTN